MNDGSAAAVIGAGPSGLAAAEVLAEAGVRVTVYDRMPTAGRKLLMAGRGGLNLTHSEPLSEFLSRYRPNDPTLTHAVERFTPEDLRAWSAALGQSTFIGSSGRVFPRSMKASPLLRAWLQRLSGQGVQFAFRHRWIGWTVAGALAFDAPAGRVSERADVSIFALGGGSWPALGSDGLWVDRFRAEGLSVASLRAANCGFQVGWSTHFRDKFQGAPLHNIALRFGSELARGEALITRDGIEGGAVYALSASLRDAIERDGAAVLTIDLRPDLEADVLAERLSGRRPGQSLATALRKTLKLAPVAVGLLHEAALTTGRPLAGLGHLELSRLVRAVPLRLCAAASLARAISSAGGVPFDAIDSAFMLRSRPGTFVAGEMIDWEAPTGGYLLQACLATGRAAGQGALDWLRGSHAA